MHVAFFTPNEEQMVGGLKLAITSLAAALTSSDMRVSIQPQELAGIDLVHFHGLWQPSFLKRASACRAQDIKYVVSPHGMLEPWAWRHKWWKKWPYFHLFERNFIGGSSGILTTSQLETDHIQHYRFKAPVTEISLGLTEVFGPGYAKARTELAFSDQEFILLYLSRIHPKKGLHLLLEALRRFSPIPIPLRLLVIGDGPADYSARVKKFVDDNRRHLPPVEFLGPVWGKEKWLYLQGADLFCLPTFSENFGLAVLEACQVGTPVLTTNGTPWGPFLSNHQLPVADPSIDSIEKSLQTILNAGKYSDRQRARLSSATHARFSWNNLTGSYRTFYASKLTAG